MDILIPILNSLVINKIFTTLSSCFPQETLGEQRSLSKDQKIRIVTHPMFKEYYSSLNFAVEFLTEYNSSCKEESKVPLDKVTDTEGLINLFIDLIKNAKTKDKVQQLWYSAATEKLLLASSLEKKIIKDLKGSPKATTSIRVIDSSPEWKTKIDVKNLNTSFWIINDKGSFIRFPTIFDKKDEEMLSSLDKKKNLSDEESSLLNDLRERSDIQNFAINFEDRIIELIIGISLSTNRTFFPKKEEYKGSKEDYLKNAYDKNKQDICKYAEYRKNLMFLDTLFVKKNVAEFFKNSKKEKLETDFLDTYWEVVRDKFFWKKKNITDCKDAMKNFSNYKLEKTLGKYNPENVMNNFVRSFFIFALKQIRRRVDCALFNLATEIAPYYKPKGMFKKFDDEVEIGRFDYENPETVTKNYFKQPEQVLVKENVVKYKEKAQAFKTLYNKMDLRSTFIGQQLNTDFNRCLKNKNLVSLLNQRRREATNLKKKKDVIKVLPKTYSKKVIHSLGSKMILNNFPSFNPVHEFLCLRGIDSLIFSQEIIDAFDIKKGTFSKEGIEELSWSLGTFLNEKKLLVKDQKIEEEQLFNSILAICKEFTKDLNPNIKK